MLFAIRVVRHAGLAAHRADLFAAHELATSVRCRHFIGKVLTNVGVSHSGAVHGSRDPVLFTESNDFHVASGFCADRV